MYEIVMLPYSIVIQIHLIIILSIKNYDLSEL